MTWKTLGNTAQLIVDALAPLKADSTDSAALGAISTESNGDSDLYRDPPLVAVYQGHGIYRLRNGLYYTMETGCWETLPEAADSIDRWLSKLEADILDGDFEQPPRRRF